jgi:DMSO/TMAO reductase YedYZ molybdopterin-dependent catalytic subunit
VANLVEKIERLLPPGQYEVRALRTLHYGPVPPFAKGSWTLKVDGLVGRPLTLTYREVKGLPSVVSVSDFHCVTGWTKFGNRWEGVAFETIQEMAEPLNNARYVIFLCEGDYTTSLPLEDLNREGILLAYRLDGRDLPLEHGGPLRLVVPHKYAYKSAKWVRRITFLEENELGFWEVRGYSDTADPFANDRYSKRRGTTN